MKLNILAETLQVYLISLFATYLTQVNKDLGTGTGSVVTHMVCIQRLGCRIWISQMVNGESNGECIQAFVSHGPSTFLHQWDDASAHLLLVVVIWVLEHSVYIRIVSSQLLLFEGAIFNYVDKIFAFINHLLLPIPSWYLRRNSFTFIAT